MKAFVISDTHFGMSNINLEKWLKISQEFFWKFFIPYVEENWEEGDIILHLGDLFDNRTSVNIKAFNEVLKIWDYFEEKKWKSYIIVGNHDMFNEVSREFNSVNILKHSYSTIIDQPRIIEFGDRKCAFMPYITSIKEQREILKILDNSDYLFCHTDLLGCRLRQPTKADKGLLEKGLPVEEYIHFKQVWSGHIHIRQELKNFTYVGSPFHQDRNDRDNKKGIYILNFDDMSHIFIENKISPEYKIIEILSESEMSQFGEKTKDWVDLVIRDSLLVNNPNIRKKIEELCKINYFENIININDITHDDEIIEKEINMNETKLDIKNVLNKTINSLELNEKNKNKMNELVEEIFKLHHDKFNS